jgi:tryptophan synthase alpha chain
MKLLEQQLRSLRSSGRKALVPYFVAGLTPDWTQHVEAAVLAGADAIEIGIPFSDPMIDGVVIQEGVLRSLEAGTTLDSICKDLSSLSTHVPLVAMTYYNIFFHYGLERAAGKLAASGITGAIVPDLTIEESREWHDACDADDIATIFIVAPSSTPDRVALLASGTEGFCYASARMAVTGRSADAVDAKRVVADARAISDVPVYVGIGIGTPEQARDASMVSDGVIVGTALVQLILDGGDVRAIEDFIGSFRLAIDTAPARSDFPSDAEE